MTTIRHHIRAAFHDAGVSGWLHARDIESGAEVAVDADQAVVMASLFKLPLVVTLFRAADAGEVDLAEPVTLTPQGRTSGPTGIGAMRDPVTVSLRDAAYLALALSDNAAADALLARLGVAAVNDMLDSVGLPGTRVRHSCRDQHEAIAADAGGHDPALLADPAVVARLRVLEPAATNRSTPRETTTLLGMLWRDEVASPDLCRELRRILGLQVWPHRLASGFPFDDVAVAGKTGTLPTLRNEAGVAEYPDGGRYAIAVYTRSVNTAFTLPAADAVIGTAARLAVDHLRARS